MAHGYLENLQNGDANIYSAGIETHGLNRGAVSIMAEDGIDITSHTCNHVDEYDDIEWDIIITVCDHAKENCPFISSKNAKRIHHNFFDPSKVIGADKEKHAAFLKARNQIRDFCKEFVANELS
jgi:arsenate reductase